MNKVYSRDDLECFNLLERPIWVFDIINQTMWWGNTASLKLWNAESLEEFLARDYKSDMSQTTSDRLNSYLERFKQHEKFTERVTFYPKGQPVTVNLFVSGIHTTTDGLLMLNEGIDDVKGCLESSDNNNNSSATKVSSVLSSSEISTVSERRIELYRYLPLAVTQFDSKGNVMEQNPEAMKTFAGSNSSGPSFIERFVDKERGNQIFKRSILMDLRSASNTRCCNCNMANNDDDDENVDQVHVGENKSSNNTKTTINANNSKANNNNCGENSTTTSTTYSQECEEEEELLHTTKGPRWFAVKARRSRDPVTGETVVLVSARDITALRKAREEADQARRAEFFAVMAHEIRTPLHQVIGFIDLLGKTKLSTTQSEHVCFLQSSAKCLMTIINDLLDYTKLEASKMKIERIPYNVTDVVLDTVAAIRPKTKEKGITIKHCFQQNVPTIANGDPTRLRQLLLNLLHNAVKFTDTGGTISLHVSSSRPCCLERKQTANGRNSNSRRGDDGGGGETQRQDPEQGQKEEDVVTVEESLSSSSLRFEIHDTGIGISPKSLKHLFSKYRQADATIARNYGGTGLGLAICKRLIELMSGSIGVTSQLGIGSKFWFELPSYQEEITMETSKDDAGDGGDGVTTTTNNNNNKRKINTNSKNNIKKTKNNDQQQDNRTNKKTRKLGDERGFNILVAEDNVVNRKLVTALLKQLGHVPTTVENGLLAVQALLQQQHSNIKYDLVLMDVQMPVMDGFEATKKIREFMTPNELPIIGLTADFQPSELDKYKKVGMNDCLGKPIRMKDLDICMVDIMKARKAAPVEDGMML